MIQFYFNELNELDYKSLDPNISVFDFMKIHDEFLKKYPLPCSSCTYNCCRMNWLISADNVFVKLNSDEISTFSYNNLDLIEDKLYMKKQLDKKKCIFLDKNDKCCVYKTRSITCRLFTCYVEGKELTLLKDLLAHAFEEALTFEYILEKHKNQNKDVAIEVSNFCKANPSVFAKDYKVPIKDILDWARLYVTNEEYSIYSKILK